ncbi:MULTISPECIES: ribosome silencing factor [Brevibacterium]|nr:ribosome silencing factor [Brevibacterium casei]MBE4693625.1 ribosome silencing factor [Brevibacterium casei]MBY3576748.1 ribosome silencing factor [Brevibacterium casei]MCT1447461.1 ribosome silencing factor [Brevibacterium casei]MCT1766622.1 ribosome silencing factor [Brevibacterium casei]MCT2183005.1 ribosome silencing factor [Brevibacterium casei]
MDTTDLLRTAAKAADDKLGTDIVALDVSSTLYITDAFLIVSADSERQVGAIVDGVEEALLKELGRKPLRREGRGSGDWVLLDYGDIVVHVFSSEQREYYALERLWKDVPVIDVGLGDASGQATGTEETPGETDVR